MKKTYREYGFTTVVSAAIINGNYISLGKHHADCACLMLNNNKIKFRNDFPENYSSVTCGYITSEGEFVDREEAWKISKSLGLIEENCQCFNHRSEDFYCMCCSEFDFSLALSLIKNNLIIKSKDAKVLVKNK